MIPWGHFAREIGLVSGIEAIKLSQKVYEHTPKAKVLGFLVAILSGAKYLQDISLAAHPLDKDLAVAEAWGQARWADFCTWAACYLCTSGAKFARPGDDD